MDLIYFSPLHVPPVPESGFLCDFSGVGCKGKTKTPASEAPKISPTVIVSLGNYWFIPCIVFCVGVGWSHNSIVFGGLISSQCDKELGDVYWSPTLHVGKQAVAHVQLGQSTYTPVHKKRSINPKSILLLQLAHSPAIPSLEAPFNHQISEQGLIQEFPTTNWGSPWDGFLNTMGAISGGQANLTFSTVSVWVKG